MSSFFENIFSVKNQNGKEYIYKVVTICFIKMKFRTNRKIEIPVVEEPVEIMPYDAFYEPREFSYCSVGCYTYGFNPENVLHHSATQNERLRIGNYCSIAPNVMFVLSSDHPYKGLSTYPFKVMILGHEFEAVSKGDIIIKDDVWIGLNSIILSGVTIGQGAVVAAGSVVTKDVPPYAIVGGNPAKVIKYRFEPEVIEKLLKFDYSKLTEEKVKSLGEKLYTKITKENVDELLKEFH